MTWISLKFQSVLSCVLVKFVRIPPVERFYSYAFWCGDRDRSFMPVGTGALACSECCSDLYYKNLKAKGDVDAVLLFQIENFAISKVKTYIAPGHAAE